MSIENMFHEASVLFQAGRFNDDEQKLRAILSRQPKHFAALNILGIISLIAGKYSQAESWFNSALAINPDADVTLSNYGIALHAQAKAAEALAPLCRAIELNPNAPQSWNARGAV